MFQGFDFVIPVLVVLVILFLFAGIKTIPQGYNYTVGVLAVIRAP